MNFETQELCERALADAPTLLENMFWGWLLGHVEAEVYFEELAITELRGYGNMTDNFAGDV